ncbi:hypothetical protein ACJX0J_018725, partial [Zea mays]
SSQNYNPLNDILTKFNFDIFNNYKQVIEFYEDKKKLAALNTRITKRIIFWKKI